MSRKGAFRVNITFEGQAIMKAKTERIEDIEPIFNELKKKFKGGKQ